MQASMAELERLAMAGTGTVVDKSPMTDEAMGDTCSE